MKVLVVGAGNMGASHARAYHQLEEYSVAGIVTRSEASRAPLIESLGGDIPGFDDFDTALAEIKPDVVSINTYPETHEEFATKALNAGAHVFMEKPIAETVEAAQRIVDLAREKDRKLVIGYILRVHPSWIKFIEIARTLGNPLVMRMNLNQQSKGRMWDVHRNLMNSMSPIVDCGVHYVDVMCQMTRSKPIKVNGIGARLSDELKEGMYNYGQLQVVFENGSVGWYEAGWGPMMSETAFFVKDAVGPKGSVSIVADKASGESKSDNVDSHTKTESLRVHHAEQDDQNEFTRPDEIIDLADEPDHDELCLREQQFLLNAIEKNVDLSDHMDDAVNSLKIVLAADQAFKEGRTIDL